MQVQAGVPRRSRWGTVVVLASAAMFCVVSQAAPVAVTLDLLATPAPVTGRPERKMLLDVARCGRQLLAVGEFGLIAASGDEGKTWRQIPAPTSVMLTAISCANERVGWAVGHDGVILATTDGGAHWTRQLDGAAINQQVLDAARARRERIRAMGSQSQNNPELLERAEDLLADAQAAVAAGPSRPLMSVRFVGAQTAFAAGSYGQLLRTFDAGKTWTYIGDRLPNPTGLHLNSIELGRNGELYIAAEAGAIFRSRDQGQTWTRTDVGYSGNLYGVVAAPAAIVAYGFRGHLFRSADGGTTWQPVVSPSDKTVVHGEVLEGGRIVLATQEGELLTSSDGGRSFVVMPQKVLLRKLRSFSFDADKRAVIAVGVGGASSLTFDFPEK